MTPRQLVDRLTEQEQKGPPYYCEYPVRMRDVDDFGRAKTITVDCARSATHHGGGGAAPEFHMCAKHAAMANRREGPGTAVRYGEE